jgi:hypothetical protein
MVVSFIDSSFTSKVEYEKWASGCGSPGALAAAAAPVAHTADVGSASTAPAAKTHPLCTVTEAADVPAEFTELAKTWPLWDSKTHPQKPKNSGKFRFDYNGSYHSERVLIMSGAATLKPTDGSAAIQIKAGDQVTFWHGFSCDWTVTARMTKHYSYYGEDGHPEGEDLPGIACDVCGVDCYAESYLYGEETDLCPKCYSADTKYTGAEHQKEGAPVKAAPKKRGKSPTKGGGGKAAKKK